MSDNDQRQQVTVPETSEELVSLAQEYFSHEFPDPSQRCPSPGEIVELIESGRLPDEALRGHLFTCSRCFVTYKERLQKSRDMQPVIAPVRQHRFAFAHYPWLRILAPSLPVFLIATIGVIYFRSRPSNTQEGVTSVNRRVEVGNANENVVAAPSPERTAPSNNIETARHIARVDLRNYSPQRGNVAGADPPPLQIEEKPTAFMITLPERSPTGRYSVSIVDAFGKTIKTRTSYSVDGKRLTATLNLNNLKSEKYRLCVSRSDEPPNCYPVVITSRGK